MKGYERRAIGQDGFCNLDVWNPQIGCWSKTKQQYDDEQAARKAARKPGQYRISRTANGVRTESEPFTI